jgi:endo-1,4-beta-D-glucanase Y
VSSDARTAAALVLICLTSACNVLDSVFGSSAGSEAEDASLAGASGDDGAASPFTPPADGASAAPAKQDAGGSAGTVTGEDSTPHAEAGQGDVASPSEASAPPMRGPAPAANGAQYPFPQNRQSSRCTYPDSYQNADVQAAYAQWTTDTVTTSGAGGFRRVQRLSTDPGLQVGSTVSEGIGYGMLIAVYMNDQSLFDDLWKYEQLHLGGCSAQTCPAMNLMDWYISADGSQALGTGAATDADEDMAFALVMADRQWGGQGSLSKTYLQTAIDQISAIWVLEVYQSNLIKPGTWGDNTTVNVSYFAPAYYRVFKAVGGNLPKPGDAGSWNPDWDSTIDTVYTTIDNSLNSANGNQSNGLVPAWCTSAGVPNSSALSSGNPTNYQYDSCRTPFRVGLDWCWNGETRAQAYVAKTSSFFSAIGATNIVDGYALNGTPQPQNPGKLSAAFIGPAAVGAMSAPTYQMFLDGAYATVATRTALAGGTYYEDSWTVMSLLMMTANFLDYSMLP